MSLVTFYRTTRMHSSDRGKMSLRLSHADILLKRLNIPSKFFTIEYQTILVFLYRMSWQYSRPLTGASNPRGYEKVMILDQSVDVISVSSSQTILVFPYRMSWQYSDWDPPNGGFQCKGA